MKFGPWEPDNAVLGAQNLSVCRNVYATATGYAPVRGLSQIAPAMDEDYSGGASFLASDGAARMLAGTATDLYSLVAGAWTSLVDSLTAGKPWHFVQFGDFVVATYGGPPVEVTLSANTADVLAGSPPDADLCAVVRDFVVLGRCDGDETMVTWSAFNDHTGWTPGTNQSGFQPMLTGGKITGLAGGEYGLILQRERITRMTYTGDPDVPFQFDEISTNYGCVAEGSVAQAGGTTFCLSRRGFIKIDAGVITPIGVERVDRVFGEAYGVVDLEQISATVDPERTLVIWHLFGRSWCYNWSRDRWTDWSMNTLAVLSSFTSSVSIDQLDAIYGNLDDVPYSLDDPRFSGGDPKVAFVAADGTFNVLSGGTLAAAFTVAPQEPFPGRRARISKARPITDAIDGITLKLSSSQRQGDAVEVDSYTSLRPSGDMPVRTSGRYITATLEIAAGTDWSNAQGIDFPGMAMAGER